jgi:CBS domain containing-hemolysin-like protein
MSPRTYAKQEGNVRGDVLAMTTVLFAEGSDPTWQLDLLALVTLPALIVLNGLFVSAEFALVAVRRTRIEELVTQGATGARAAASNIQHLDRSIAATQLGITLASIALGWVGEPALSDLLQPLFSGLTPAWGTAATHTVAVGIAFCLITFMHVVFGELVPKNMALQSPDRTALTLARPLQVFVKLTRPVILLINGTGLLVLRLLGYRATTGATMVHSVEELALLIEDTEQAGILDPEQADMVQNVFRLSNKHVSDCMVPRDKMGMLELASPPERVLEAVRSGAHTRMPVYEGTPDNIVGVVNTKNLFFLFSLRGVVVLEDALYPALFLKPDESVANALRLFRKARRPMAVVRSEEGKVLGLVTLEDILEEIIGDIEDEHDHPVPLVPRRRKNLKR